MFRAVVDFIAANPLECVNAPAGAPRFVYGISNDDLKTIFAKEGFNLNKPSWTGYLSTWMECNMLRSQGEFYLLTDNGLDMVPGGRTLAKSLEMANKVGGQAVRFDGDVQ